MLRFAMGPEETLLEQLRAAARRHGGGRARIAAAWARNDGVRRLLEAVADHIEEVHVIVGINERGTTVEALLRLLKHVKVLRYFYKHPRQTFHPKLYWFDDGRPTPKSTTIIVGSSNLTQGGLITNFEASLVAELDSPHLTATDRALLRSVSSMWESLGSSRYAHILRNADDVRWLYDNGYIVTEQSARRRHRRRIRTTVPAVGLPTAPPPWIGIPPSDEIAIPFPLHEERPEPVEEMDRRGLRPAPDRFFVRTLTRNDVRKLHGVQSGTFEPDLGQTARDRFPSFWGWPDNYREVVHRDKPRKEWRTRARLISSLTPHEGVEIGLTLWFRDERMEQGGRHAAEHRVSLTPITSVRQATPTEFDTRSLVVVQRAPAGSDYDFIVRLLTSKDTEFNDFATYLTEERPEHRFGYGPTLVEIA